MEYVVDVGREEVSRGGSARFATVWALIGALVVALFALAASPDIAVADEALESPPTTLVREQAPPTTVVEEQIPPSISAKDTTDLVDGQLLTINGRGYSAVGGFGVWQCTTGDTDLSGCDPGVRAFPEGHNRNGRWTATMRVQRFIDTPSGEVDCVETSCSVVLIEFYGESTINTRSVDSIELGFDPAVPAAKRPEASVRPRQNLGYAQEVSVQVSGLAPFERGTLLQCSALGPLAGACGNYSDLQAEVDGTGVGTIRVTRTMFAENGETIDCAVEKCFVLVSVEGRSPAPMRLRFDPDAQAGPQPEVNVSKRRGLVDGQIVTVEVVPVEAPNESHMYFSVLQCGMRDGVVQQNECRYLGEGGGHEIPYEEPPESVWANIGPAQPPTTTDAPVPDAPTTSVPAPAPPPAPSTTGTRLPPPPELGRFEVMLRREIRSGHGRGHGEEVSVVDCAESAGRCAVVAILGTGERIASPGLSFDPDVPPATANVVVTNVNKFVVGKTHRVKIDNYLGSWVEVRQCPRDATSHEDERCRNLANEYRGVHPTLDRFNVKIKPLRTLGSQASIDCLVADSCDLRVYGEDGPMRRVLINFDPDAEPLPQRLQVKPKRKLVDGQTVRARIRGLEPDMFFVVTQCVGEYECYSELQPDIIVWNDKNLLVDIQVDRFVGSTDCASAPKICSIRVWTERNDTMVVPLRFVKQDPPPVEVKVSPRKDLADRDVVKVEISGEIRMPNMFVRQCVVGTDSCVGSSRRDVIETKGKLTQNVTVRRVVRGVDCAERAGRCEIRVFSGEYVRATKALSFDPDGALPGPVEFEMSVTPSQDLPDGALLDVEISGSTGWYDLGQCAVIDGAFAPGSCVYLQSVRRLPNSTQTMSVVVTRNLMPAGAETSWDCATEPGSCVLAVMSGYRYGSPLVAAPLSFDPDAEPLVPEIMVSPSEGLVDGQTVTVVGSDWIPGLNVFAVPCFGPIDELSIDQCDTENLTPAVVGRDGTLSFPVTLSDSVLGQDCRVVECRLGVGDPYLRQSASSNRLYFS